MSLNVFAFFAELFRIMRLLESQLRLRCVLVMFLLLIQSLLELGFILTLTSMALALSDSERLRGTPFYDALFQLFPSLGDWAEDPHHLLLLAGIVLIAASMLKSLVNFFAARSIAQLGEDISYYVGMEIMQRFLYQNYAWHLSPASKNMYQRMTWRGNLAIMITHLLNMYACLFTIAILFVSLAGQEPVLTALVISITGTVGILLYVSVRKNVDSSAKSLMKSRTQENRTLLCAARGIREVLLYGQQQIFLQKLSQSARLGRRAKVYGNIVATMPTWVLEATGFMVVVGAINYLIYVEGADSQRITSALALLLLTAWRVLPFCNRIVSLHISVRSLRPTVGAVVELLEKLRTSGQAKIIAPSKDFTFEHQIDLRNVTYRYPGAKQDSLRNISLVLRKGEKIGLIGASGAGKSTLAAILAGLLPVSSGELLVDGQPLTPARAAAFTRRVGYVPQNPFLFGGTLAENIAFSQWGKPWDRQRVLEVCKLAAIDFVNNHPKKLQRPLGENCAGLSGGQAQRVAIARALYARPEVLIFDEATSALDQGNENIIQQTIDRLSKQTTCVIIAHRLSTVRKCDRIFWLDKGKIVRHGVPEDIVSDYENALRQNG